MRNLTAQGCCPHGWVAWDKPADAGPVALAWVFHYKPGAAPATPDEQAALDARMQQGLAMRLAQNPLMEPAYPTVIDARLLATRPVLVGAMAALALGAAASLVPWALRLRRAEVPDEGPGSESLLRLYGVAGAHLETVRDLLLGTLVVAAGVALHVALIGEPETAYRLMRHAGVGNASMDALRVTLSALYAAVAVAWGYAVWRAQRGLRRWRRRRDAQPEI